MRSSSLAQPGLGPAFPVFQRLHEFLAGGVALLDRCLDRGLAADAAFHIVGDCITQFALRFDDIQNGVRYRVL